MKILIACEESQTITTAMRALGHEAYSCDIQEASGNHPEWHVKGNCLPLLRGGGYLFETMDGRRHEAPDRWDLVIAHPPCTYLSGVTTRHLSLRCTPAQKVVERMWNVAEAAVFFMHCIYANADRVCVENPSGFMSRLYRKPDQTVHPYYFATDTTDEENYEKKRTCFWLRNLPPLKRLTELPAPPPKGYTASGKPLNFEECATGNRSKVRSKTFPGIAKAMAEQWAGNITQPEKHQGGKNETANVQS